MEDEEGELFDNTYLDELKSGSGILAAGRDSLTLEEIQRRNSMVPAHLRSSYLPQYTDVADRKVSETISRFNKIKYSKKIFFLSKLQVNENTYALNDSMFSNQSESRRGTLYKRPGNFINLFLFDIVIYQITRLLLRSTNSKQKWRSIFIGSR